MGVWVGRADCGHVMAMSAEDPRTTLNPDIVASVLDVMDLSWAEEEGEPEFSHRMGEECAAR